MGTRKEVFKIYGIEGIIGAVLVGRRITMIETFACTNHVKSQRNKGIEIGRTVVIAHGIDVYDLQRNS